MLGLRFADIGFWTSRISVADPLHGLPGITCVHSGFRAPWIDPSNSKLGLFRTSRVCIGFFEVGLNDVYTLLGPPWSFALGLWNFLNGLLSAPPRRNKLGLFSAYAKPCMLRLCSFGT